MPRVLKTAAAQTAASKVSVSRVSINLQSIPHSTPATTTGQQLRNMLFSHKPPEQDLWRSRYGRALNLNLIESSLRAADWGNMRMLTDLSRETIDTDPHLAAVLNKRFGAISALPWEVQPADGYGIDKDKARFYADVVRAQIEALPDFGQRVHQLAWALFDGRAALELKWLLAPMQPNFPIPVHPEFGAVNWVVQELGWIHPRRLHFGPERELRVYDDLVSASFAEHGFALRDHKLKFIHWTPQLFGDYPEREGLARRCLYWSFFKRFSARERMVLLELFGKPWRWLEVDEDSTAGPDDLTSADELLQNVGGNSGFRFPRGTKFKVEQPAEGAGQIHADTITESDKQISKLVLGQTGTTDANPAGLNNAQANVMQDEQFMILMRDARMISEVLETFLSDPIIEINFGPQELGYAPKFVLRADVPLDRNKELERLHNAIKAGLEVPLNQAYEISGFREPKEDEPVIKLETPPVHPLAVQPNPERPVIVYPETANLVPRKTQPISPVGEGGLPQPQQLRHTAPVDTDKEVEDDVLDDSGNTVPDKNGPQINPSDVAKIITVNEARASQGLGPMMRPDGTPDPDGFLTVHEFAAKREALAAAAGKVAEELGTHEIDDEDKGGKGEGGEGGAAPAASGGAAPGSLIDESTRASRLYKAATLGLEGAHPSDLTVVKTVVLQTVGAFKPAGVQLAGDHSNARQPEEKVIGSLETLIEKGTKEGARALEKLVDEYVKAVQGLDDAKAINAALERVHDDVDVHNLSRGLERRILHSAMAGAIANHYEFETETVLPVAEFERHFGQRVFTLAIPPTDPNFVERPLQEAVKWFREKAVVTRTVFDRLEAAAKRRAFTVAGMSNNFMLQKTKDALEAKIRTGGTLREFAEFVRTRLESAGFTPANPSHVETVYRTNVLNAYNSGRHAQATQPSVLRVRPYWQIRTVNDGPPRQRATHQAVHLWVLSATDPVWATAYPPFGFNCRCRVTTLSEPEVKARSLRIRSGGEMAGLPDPGFTSGTGSLL